MEYNWIIDKDGEPICPVCGTMGFERTKFCHNCGTKMENGYEVNLTFCGSEKDGEN